MSLKTRKTAKSSTRALGVLIILTSFGFYGTVAYGASMSGVVTGDSVNVRKSHSTSSAVITKVNKGHKVTITGTVGDFYHVYFPGMDDGYISTQFVNASEVVSTDTGKITGANVNIRSGPSTNTTVIAKANSGDSFNVTGSQSGWYKIIYNGAEAYVSADFFKVEGSGTAVTLPVMEAPTEISAAPPPEAVATPTAMAEPTESIYAVVTSVTGLNLRQLPTLESTAINTLLYGEVVDVSSILQEWVEVVYENQKGYVSAEFVDITRGVKPEPLVHEAPNGLAQQIIDYGKQFIGTPYVYGGTNLNSGVDCSGFVYAVMKNFGINLNRSSYAMINNGPIVQKSQLSPGDLVFFDTTGVNDGGISHVGIYIGNSKFIHSSSSKRTWGVTISSLSEDYYIRTYVAACRVL